MSYPNPNVFSVRDSYAHLSPRAARVRRWLDEIHATQSLAFAEDDDSADTPTPAPNTTATIPRSGQ